MSTQAAQKTPGTPDATLQQRIDETRRLVRQVDISLALLSSATLLFGGVILAMLADHWLFRGGLSGTARMGVFVGLLGAVALFVYRRIVPLFLYPINPVYAAQVLERGSPSIKNSVINWILLRRERLERGGTLSDKLAERMMDGVARSAAVGVDSIPAEKAVETQGVVRWGIALTLLLLFLVGYTMLSPKNPLTSIVRILLPFSSIDAPQAVQFRDIRPGNGTALQGERITVSAEVVGRSREPVYLFFSTDDGQALRQAVPMMLPEGKTRYEAPFPPGKSGFVSGVEYWIGQGESESGRFRIDVREIASLEVASVTYRYPEYTGLAEESVETGGDIRAVEGTEVQILLRSSLPMERAEILFDNDPVKKLGMKISGDRPTEATVAYELTLDPETPEVAAKRSFTFRAVDAEGYESRRSGVFRLEILPDRAPKVQWSDTATELKDVAQMELPLNASIELPIQAEDPDFSLRNLRFHVESGNKRIRPVELIESPMSGPTEHRGQIERKTIFSPATSRLTVGDTAEIWAEAVDSKLPEPKRSTTRRITINVVEPQKQENLPKEPPKEPEKQEKQPEENDKTQKPGNEEKQNQENENRRGDPAKQDAKEQNEARNDESSAGKGEDEQGNGRQEREEKTPAEENRDSNGESDNSPENRSSEDGENSENSDGTDGTKDSTDSNPSEQENQRGKDGNQPEKPIDPETNPGDAMQRILDQMKKDKKIPEDQNQQGEQQQENDGKDDQKADSKPQGKREQQQEQKKGEGPSGDQPSQEQKQEQNRKPECPDGKCGECGKCNGGSGDEQEKKSDGEKSGNGSKDGQPGPGQDSDDKKDGSQGNDPTEGQQAGKGDEKSGNPSQQGAEQGDQQKSDNEKQPGANDQGGGAESEDESQADNQGAGGGKTPSPGKEKGGGTSGGDEAGDTSSDAERREGDNRNSDKQDIPVDPNDDRPRQRDNLDPNLKDRRSQGGNPSDPKKSDETAKDVPQNTVSSGDEGQGRETRQAGKSDRAQSAKDGKRGDTGQEGVEQKGGAEAEGFKPTKADGEDRGKGERRDDPEGEERRDSDQGEPGRERQDEQSPRRPEGETPQQQPQGAEPGREKTEGQPNAGDMEPGRQKGDDSQNSQASGGSQGASRADVDTAREEANLQYAERATNLVLEYLEEQLREGPDQELLTKLGWNEDQLRAFHRKWKEMAEKAQKSEPDSVENDAWKEFLKSLGITPSRDRSQLHRSRTDRKDESKAVESRRYAPPPAMKKRFEQYTENIGR